MKTNILLPAIFFFFQISLFATTDWGDSFVKIDKDGTGSADYWIGSDPSSGTELNTHNFGTVSTLVITGADMTYTSTSDERTGSSFFYTVKSSDGLTTLVAETEVKLTQSGPDGNDPYTYNGAISGLSINLLANLEPNTEYKLEIRSKSTGSNGDSDLDNSGSNYVATFTTSPITVYGANIITDGTGYSTMKEAFDAINATPSQANREIEIKIGASVTEIATASLSDNNWKSLVIFPTTADLVIDADMGSAVIRLNGANNVSIDGRVNESGSTASLTVKNTSSNGGAVAIDLVNSAQNITAFFNLQAGELLRYVGIRCTFADYYHSLAHSTANRLHHGYRFGNQPLAFRHTQNRRSNYGSIGRAY